MHGICKWQDNTLSNVMYNSRLQHITSIKVRPLTGDRSGHAKGHMLKDSLTFTYLYMQKGRSLLLLFEWCFY